MTSYNLMNHVIIPATVKAVIWDLDGTLLDSFEVYQAILAEAVVLHQLPMPERQVLLNNFHGTLQDSLAAALSLQNDETMAELLTSFLLIQEKFYQAPDSHLFDDAAQLAQALHKAGRLQFVVTNREHTGRGSASPRFIVEQSRLKQCIDDLVCGDEGDYRKPDKRVLDRLLTTHNLTANDVIVIGDQHVDADLAYNTGAAAIIVNRTAEPLSLLKARKNLTVVTTLDTVEVT